MAWPRPWQRKINSTAAGYQAQADGDTLVIVRKDGASFTCRYSIDDVDKHEGTGGVSHSFNLIGSPVVAGDLWSLDLNDGAGSVFTVTVSTAEADAAAPQAALASRLAAAINADADGNQVIDGAYLALIDGSTVEPGTARRWPLLHR